MKRFHWLLLLLILSTTSCSLGSPESVCGHEACFPATPPEVAMMTETAFGQNSTPTAPISTTSLVDAYPAYPPPAKEAPTPTPLAVSPLLAGLQFHTARGEYQIDAAGIPRLLPPKSKDLLTPDGQFRVIIENDEIYLENLSTQVRTNLTNSPGVPSYFWDWSVDGKWMFYREGDDQAGNQLYRVSLVSKERQRLIDLPGSTSSFVSRWPNDPSVLLVTSRPLSIQLQTVDASYEGYLYLLHLNDLKLEQVSQKIDYYFPAFPPYPAGQAPDRFIWSEYAATYVYMRGQGSKPFKLPPVENMKVDEPVSFVAPVWSPDQRWLAFQAVYKERTGWVIIDLKNQTTRLLHLYTHVGMGGHIDAPEFSPDSRWLIVNARAEEIDLNGVWLYSVEGAEKVHLPGYGAIFQQDGSHLLVKDLASQDGYFYITVGDWEKKTEVVLPTGAYVEGEWK